jgi:predicted nucleic acid-binding protein
MSILDASVILKWFVDEESSDQALRIRDEFCRGEREIVIPDLLLLEVANALRYNPTFSVEEITEAVRTLFDLEIEIVTPTYSLLAKAINLARSLDVTCYACFQGFAKSYCTLTIT